MKVYELIQALSRYDANTEVIVGTDKMEDGVYVQECAAIYGVRHDNDLQDECVYIDARCIQ